MNWYFAQNGEQKGPVSEDELKQLAASGQIRSADLVWRDGMADWASYGSVFEGQVSGVPAVAVTTPMPAGAGTGGETPNDVLRERARKLLAGQWGPAVGVVLVWFVIQQVMGFVPILGFIAVLICTGPLMLGVHEYFLRVSRKADPQFSHLFNGFSNFVLGMGIYLLVFLIVVAALFVVAIPGGILLGVVGFQHAQGSPENNPLLWVGIALISIPAMAVSLYLYLRYSMVYFIALDEPEKGVMHALKKSPAMLKGHMGKLFMMGLVFFGWSLLTIITFFIGLLWVAPYMYTSLAGFYDDLKAPSEA